MPGLACATAAFLGHQGQGLPSEDNLEVVEQDKGVAHLHQPSHPSFLVVLAEDLVAAAVVAAAELVAVVVDAVGLVAGPVVELAGLAAGLAVVLVEPAVVPAALAVVGFAALAGLAAGSAAVEDLLPSFHHQPVGFP